MSSAAAWSYTAKATHWPRTGRDGRTGLETFGPPVVFLCDYSAKAERMTDSKGVEFVSRQTIYTEKADIKPGDRVLLGEHAGDALAAGGLEVRAVNRDADTFERLADDFKVVS